MACISLYSLMLLLLLPTKATLFTLPSLLRYSLIAHNTLSRKSETTTISVSMNSGMALYGIALKCPMRSSGIASKAKSSTFLTTSTTIWKRFTFFRYTLTPPLRMQPKYIVPTSTDVCRLTSFHSPPSRYS